MPASAANALASPTPTADTRRESTPMSSDTAGRSTTARMRTPSADRRRNAISPAREPEHNRDGRQLLDAHSHAAPDVAMVEKMLFGSAWSRAPHDRGQADEGDQKSDGRHDLDHAAGVPKGADNTRPVRARARVQVRRRRGPVPPDGYMPVLVVAADDEVDLPAFGQLEEEVGEQRADAPWRN